MNPGTCAKINRREFVWRGARGVAQWVVLGHESGKGPLKAGTRSFEALKRMGKV